MPLRLPRRAARAPGPPLRGRAAGVPRPRLRRGAGAPEAGPGARPEARRGAEGDREDPGTGRPRSTARTRRSRWPGPPAELVAAKKAAEEPGAGSSIRPRPTGAPRTRDVTRGLRDAQALAARARASKRTDPPRRRDLYRRSLAIAADLARSSRRPRPLPARPAVRPDRRVRRRPRPAPLGAPTPDGLGPVTFVILRKPEAAFAHPADGVRIGEIVRGRVRGRGRHGRARRSPTRS